MGLLKNGESSAPIFDAPRCCSVGPDRVLVTSPELWYPEAESVTPDAHCVSFTYVRSALLLARAPAKTAYTLKSEAPEQRSKTISWDRAEYTPKVVPGLSIARAVFILESNALPTPYPVSLPTVSTSWDH